MWIHMFKKSRRGFELNGAVGVCCVYKMYQNQTTLFVHILSVM